MPNQNMHPDALSVLGVEGDCQTCEWVQGKLEVMLEPRPEGSPTPPDAIRAVGDIRRRVVRCPARGMTERIGSAVCHACEFNPASS